MRHILAPLCALLLAACSAEVSVQTEPLTQAIPITSVLEPVYVEVAVDLPEASQGDILVQEVSATAEVVNPSRGLTLKTSARLSLEGTATPDKPVFYNRNSLPPYFNTAEVLLPETDFPAGSRTPVTLGAQTLTKALGKERLYIIVSNTVTRVGLGDVFPLEIVLDKVVLRATVTKPFDGLGGALDVSGL